MFDLSAILNKKFQSVLKRAWLTLVFVGVAVYIAENFERLTTELQLVPPGNLFACLVLLVLGRLLLVEVSRESTTRLGWRPPYNRMLYFYSVSQLARYLPGGFWHFVGLAGFYSNNGLSVKNASKAILLEYMWLAISTGIVSLMFLSYYYLTHSLPVILALLVAWGGALWLVSNAYLRRKVQWLSMFKMFGLQTIIWGLIGASFWALLPVKDIDNLLVLSIGAFAIAWLIGFIAVFAPGGIGVREAVLTIILATVINPETALLYAGIHRLAYVIGDLVIFMGQQADERLKKLTSEINTSI